jgi:hypothetical protein
MLRDVIQGMRAKRLIVVLDVCYSNGAYSQIASFLPPGGKSLGMGRDEGYGRSREDMAKRLLGAKDLIIDPPPTLPPASLPSLPNGWGTVLISASDAGERSWESDRLRNGIFTHFFLKGLQQYRGALKESFEFAKPLVQQQVKEEKDPDID